MTKIPTFKLNDGTEIPSFGFGVFQIPADGSTYKAVLEALKIGYRHIDTAAVYFNEAEVGKAIRDSGIPRDEIWVTSKLWLQDYAYEDAKKAIDTSLNKLGLDYIDLYLIHQPYGKVDEVWKAMAEKYGKDVSQIILRFEHQEGVVVFPKSVHEARIKSNKDIFDFELTSDEMDAIRGLDKNGEGMHDPDAPGVEEMLLNAFDIHSND